MSTLVIPRWAGTDTHFRPPARKKKGEKIGAEMYGFWAFSPKWEKNGRKMGKISRNPIFKQLLPFFGHFSPTSPVGPKSIFFGHFFRPKWVRSSPMESQVNPSSAASH